MNNRKQCKNLLESKTKIFGCCSSLGSLKSTDPGYIEQVDIMNSVNRSFENLDANIKGYTKDKVTYYDNFDNGKSQKEMPLGTLKRPKYIILLLFLIYQEMVE